MTNQTLQNIIRDIVYIHNETMPLYTHSCDEKTWANIASRTQKYMSERYKSYTSIEKFIFNASYIAYEIMLWGFNWDGFAIRDKTQENLNNRIGTYRRFVDYTQNSASDEAVKVIMKIPLLIEPILEEPLMRGEMLPDIYVIPPNDMG